MNQGSVEGESAGGWIWVVTMVKKEDQVQEFGEEAGGLDMRSGV